MTRTSSRNAAFSTILATALGIMALMAGCSSGMDGNQNFAAGDQVVRNGIAKARAGITQYQAGDPAGGLAAIDQGRGMMGQGVATMGLGCCLSDGGVIVDDGGVPAGCVSTMGMGATPMMQGLANFDAAHQTMMASSDAGTIGQAMADMETAMQMMEQGAGQMMTSRGMGMTSGM
jgi:hypothetical protein